MERDLISAGNFHDPQDIRRWYGVSLEAASVFNGLGKIANEVTNIDRILDCMWNLEMAAEIA